MESSSSSNNSALHASVLVLNRFYLAVHVVSVRRAFGLLYQEHAEVLDLDDGQYTNYDFATWLEFSELRGEAKRPADEWIRSVRFEILVPRIIRLLKFDKVPQYSTRFSRKNLFARDNNQCQYCSRVLPASQLSIDHVRPRSQDGQTTWENVVACCLKCNTKKGGRTPQQARMNLIRPPRKPAGNPLFLDKLSNPKYATWQAFVGRRPTTDVA